MYARLKVALVISLACLVLGLALVWGYAMRRKVAIRSVQLAQEIAAREAATLEFDAILRERRRLANDLHDTLEQAQLNKLERICQKLALKPSDHLLEIGTGWGSMAIYAATHYGCKVTTTTISREQHDYAAEKIREAGLESQITLLFQDYRDLTGTYDKLVSIEMIEAVGDDFLDQYFAKCSSLLKDDGLMVLQAITIADQRYSHYVKEVDFIKRYIFPGGCLPSIQRMSNAVADYTDLVLRQVQDIGLDYARTLQDWCHNFMASRDKLHQLGYDDQFIRLWHFYLCYCEGGFLERATSAVHLVFTKPMNRNKI
jgi:cyclopropane-fatty-acyl-phospholipid synthase